MTPTTITIPADTLSPHQIATLKARAALAPRDTGQPGDGGGVHE